MPNETFYTVVSSVSFTLLGLWWVVVQNNEAWRRDPGRRAMAWAVSLHFALPGAMSIMSLVAPDVGWLWRATFVAAGLLGIGGVGWFIRTLREEYDAPTVLRIIEYTALPIYVVVTVLALFPELARTLVPDLAPIQVEGFILAILVFLGVQAAWILTIEPPRATAEPAARDIDVMPRPLPPALYSEPVATASPARDQSLNEPG
jgi:hypothetical protein